MVLPLCFNNLRQGACNMKEKEITTTTKEVEGDKIVNAIAELSKQKDFNPDTFEKLINLQSKMKAEQQREAFSESFSKFQAECPIIKKTTIRSFKE